MIEIPFLSPCYGMFFMIYTNEEYKYLTRKGIDPSLFRKTYAMMKKTFGKDIYICGAEVKKNEEDEMVLRRKKG